jgi:MFS family permease
MVFISFALPLRAEDLGASGFEIGLLFSVFTASLLVVRPVAGFGVDLIGRRLFFIAALVFYLAANALYAFGASFDGLLAARIVQGIGFAILAITTDTITADLTNRDSRASAMGANIASQTRGGMAGATIGFGLVGALPLHAWVYSFTTFTIVAVFGVLFAIRAMPETLPKKDGPKEKTKFRFPSEYYPLLLVIFLAAFAVAIVQPYYLIYLRARFGLELYALALAFLPVGLISAILPGLLGRMTNRLSRATAMSIGLVFSGALYFIVPNAPAILWVITAFAMSSIGSVLVDLTRNAWIGDISPPSSAGRTFGIAALSSGLGAALGPLAGGVIYDRLGHDKLFYAAGLILIVTMIVTLANRKD